MNEGIRDEGSMTGGTRGRGSERRDGKGKITKGEET